MDTYSNNTPRLMERDEFDSDEAYQEYLFHVNKFLDGLEDIIDEELDKDV